MVAVVVFEGFCGDVGGVAAIGGGSCGSSAGCDGAGDFIGGFKGAGCSSGGWWLVMGGSNNGVSDWWSLWWL